MSGADIGIDCTMDVNGVQYAANLRGCNDDFNRATRPILLTNAAANSLFGYAVSTGAKSGFMVDIAIPYGTTTGTGLALTGFLATAGITIKLIFGTAGGVSLATCIATDFEIAGQEGGDLNCRMAFESIALPTYGATATTNTIGDIFKFNDVVSWASPSGTTYTDISRFSFRIQRQLAKFTGNSITGVAKKLKVVRTEAFMDVEHLKIDDAESLAAVPVSNPQCPTTADSVLVCTAACGTAVSLTMTAAASFYDATPKMSGDVEQWLTESCSVKASKGVFSIVSA